MAGIVPDEAFWERLGQQRGPGYATSARAQWEAEQVGKGPLADAPAATIDPTLAAQAPAPAAPPPPEMLAAGPQNEMASTPLGQPSPQQQPAADATPLPGPQTVSTENRQTTIEQGHKMDPFAKAELHASQAAEAGAQQQIAEAKQQEQIKLAEIEAKRATEEAEANKRAEERAKERKTLTDGYLAKVQAAQKELDTDKGAPAETIGTQVRNRIALALGAFGAGLAGGPNHAAQIIEADRAQTLNKWKAEYARKQGKVSGAQNVYALARNQGLDEEAAEALANKRLNAGYDAIIRATKAEYAAPMTKAQADANSEQLRQHSLLQDDRINAAAENKVRTAIDSKTVTKEGGADIKTKKDLLEMADKDEFIKRARESSRALSKFNDLVKAGADGAALAEFIAGKGGLEQGSFGPNFIQLLKKRSVFGQGIEKLRETFKGGIDPALLKDLKNGLAAEYGTSITKGAKSIKYFRDEFRKAGMYPEMVTGEETADEAAQAAGATPSGYQGGR